MAQHSHSFSLLWISQSPRILPLLALLGGVAGAAGAQTPPQQYVYGSVPVSTATSQVAAFAKNGQTGALSAVAGSPFADNLQGGAVAIDGLGRFLFVANTGNNNISMYQIDQGTGNLTQVPGSPFATGTTVNPNMAPNAPVCLATEKSGQFLYVGYRFGNFANEGAINEYLIDAANRQLVPLPAQPTMDIASAPIGMVSDPKGLHLYVGLGLNPSTGMQDAGTTVYNIDPVSGALGVSGMAGNAISAGRSMAIDPQGRFFFDGWGLTLGTIDSALISPADGTAMTGISSVTSANEIPAAMLTDRSGKFLYVQEGSAPVVYAIDQTTGALTVPPVPLAVLSFSAGSAVADPLGPYLYSLQRDGVHGFLIDAQSGLLSEIAGSPFGGNASQGALAISGAPAQALSGPAAAIFPASEDFGSVTVGQSSNSQLITLTNTGGQGLSLNSISATGANPSDFEVTPNCSFPTVLSPNATCTVSVAFSPTTAGTRQASLAASDNAPGSPQTIPLSGTGASPLPAVTLMPGSLTFASTTQGSSSASQSITVTNSGQATLHISSVLAGGANPADFQVTNGCAGAYVAAASCSIAVTFSPLGAGQRTANLTINDDAPNSPQSVQLTGTGAAPPPGTPAVKLVPGNLGFGTVTQGTSVAAQTITVTNAGTGSLHISSVTLGGANAGDFALSNNCTAAAYAVAASCTVGVSFSPLAIGTRAAFISIVDDAPNSPQAISLSATVNAALTIAPAAPGANAVTVTAGQTAVFSLQLTPGAGFAGSASFACTGAPTAAACTAPSVQLAGAAISYMVSVSTTANSVMVLPPVGGVSARWIGWRALLVAAWCAVLALLVAVSRLRRDLAHATWVRVTALAVAACVCVFAGAGCGGGGVGASVSPQVVPTPTPTPAPHGSGTPPGTSVITITPTVTTSAGTPLTGIAPIQLTLTVQ